MTASVLERHRTARDLNHQIIAVAADYLVSPARYAELPSLRKLAGDLMRQKVSSVTVLRAVRAIQPSACLAYREDGIVTGLTGALILRRSAAAQLLRGEFDGRNVDPELLARGDEPVEFGYGWGIAAATKTAARALSALGHALTDGPLRDLTILTRAVTPVGRHICLSRYGYRPLRRPDDDVLIRRPAAVARIAA